MLQKMFQNPIILDSKEHHSLKFNALNDYGFTEKLTFAPIGINEFWEASKSLFVLFSGNSKNVVPVVLLGNTHNLLLNASKQWATSYYIPQIFRTYPFGVTALDSQKKVIVFDEKSGCFNPKKGKELFKDAVLTPSLKTVIDFTAYTYNQLEQTKHLSQALIDLKLLSQAQITISLQNESFDLGTFYVVDETKLKQLNSKQFRKLANEGHLNHIYMHLNSLKNQYKLDV